MQLDRLRESLELLDQFAGGGEQAPEPDVAKIYGLTGQGYALLGKNF